MSSFITAVFSIDERHRKDSQIIFVSCTFVQKFQVFYYKIF